VPQNFLHGRLNRYLTKEFGRFGVFVTRKPLTKAMFRNTVDLWSGHTISE